MTTKTTFLSFALAVVMLLASPTLSYALNYTIDFAASGVTTSVGSVQVKNLTSGAIDTVPEGNILSLKNLATAVDELQVGDEGIRISQNASSGTSTLTFYTGRAGSFQITAYALDGRKVVEQTTRLEAGDNSLELSLPAGVYVLCASGGGYHCSTKIQSQASAAAKAAIAFLRNTNVEVSTPQKSIASEIGVTTMDYTTGDRLLYTAISGAYIASVPDVPADSKTITFNFATIPSSAIPAGTFLMGSPISEVSRQTDEIQHPVTLSAFRMSKYETTNAEFAAFLNANSVGSNGVWSGAKTYKISKLIFSNSTNGLIYSNSKWVPVVGYENAPVVNVPFPGATEYAAYIGGALPTEAQWEYACRAGTTTPFNTGGFISNLQANYSWAYPYNGGWNSVTTSPGITQVAGTYAANAYGLCDMHGNVWEWCVDYYSAYSSTAQTNPTGAALGSYRVVRGGGCGANAMSCRSAFRNKLIPQYDDRTIGFRVVFLP